MLPGPRSSPTKSTAGRPHLGTVIRLYVKSRDGVPVPKNTRCEGHNANPFGLYFNSPPQWAVVTQRTMSTQQPEPPHVKCNGRHLASLWNEARSTHQAFFGRPSSLPPDPPSKTSCAKALSSLPQRPSLSQVSEAATTFQFRKVFPGPSTDHDAMWASYKEVLSRPSPPLSPEFEAAAAKTLKLLPPDWDRSYERHVYTSVPSLKACIEGLPPGTSHTVFGPEPAQTFRDICLGALPPIPIPQERHVKFLPDSGKTRTITVASALQRQLHPLHLCIQEALYHTNAVLRGPATPSSMSGMKLHPDESFVSGDYKAATDNFNTNNTVRLLQLLRTTSTRIPQAIWDIAIEFMSEAVLCFKDEEPFCQESGQLMGNLLSFPLLCLTNLVGIVLSFGLPRTRELIQKGLLKINGDDIVFRCTPTEYQTWRSKLPLCGLLLEESKTLVHPSVLTLNSTFFLARGKRRPRQVFFYRAASFTYSYDRDLPKTLVRPMRTVSLLGALSTMLAPFPGAKRLRETVYHFLHCHGTLALSSPLGLSCPPNLSRPGFLPTPWRKLFATNSAYSGLATTAPAPKTADLMDIIKIPRPPNPPPDVLSVHRFISQSLNFTRRPATILRPMPRDCQSLRIGPSGVEIGPPEWCQQPAPLHPRTVFWDYLFTPTHPRTTVPILQAPVPRHLHLAALPNTGFGTRHSSSNYPQIPSSSNSSRAGLGSTSKFLYGLKHPRQFLTLAPPPNFPDPSGPAQGVRPSLTYPGFTASRTTVSLPPRGLE